MAKYIKKRDKKNGGRIALVIVLAVLLAALIWLACVLGQWEIPTPDQSGEPNQDGSEETQDVTTESETMPDATDPQAVALSNGLVVHYISGYAGIYMEDGTDEPVTDVMMLILENTASEDLQLARIWIEYSNFTAEFEVTNLPAGEKVVTLEKNRHPEATEAYRSIQVKNVVFFPEKMGLQEDRIQIKGYKEMLEVTNISAEDITGDIYIYYKNSASDLLYGGITYRASVKDGLKRGESVLINVRHYDPENSRILMIDCGD